MNPSDEKQASIERILLFVLPAVQFTHITDFMLMMPLGPQLMRYFNIEPHAFATAVSAYTFSAAFFGLLGAFFMDNFDRKKALLFLYAGFICGTLGCAFAPTYLWLVAGRILAGAFGGMLSALILSVAGDVFPEQRRGKAMGILMSAFSVASVIGVPLGLFLANQFTWHAPFLFLAGFSVIPWIFAMIFMPSLTSHMTKDRVSEKPWAIFNVVLKSPSQLWALAFIMFIMFAGFSVIPFISPYLVANAGMSEKQLPFIYLVGGGFVFFSAQLIGRLADRWGKPKTFRLISAISIVPILLVTHLGVVPLWVILLSTTIFFIFVSGRIVPAMAMITSTVEPQHRGRFMSLNACVQQLGSGCAAQISGLIVSKSASGVLLNYGWVGWMAAGVSVLCIGISTQIRPMVGS